MGGSLPGSTSVNVGAVNPDYSQTRRDDMRMQLEEAISKLKDAAVNVAVSPQHETHLAASRINVLINAQNVVKKMLDEVFK